MKNKKEQKFEAELLNQEEEKTARDNQWAFPGEMKGLVTDHEKKMLII